MSFIQDLIDDLRDKPWPEGTTNKTKNKHRWKIVALMAAIGVGVALINPYVAIVPGLVAIRKIWLILQNP